MRYRWIVFFCAALGMHCAAAIDIPMDRKLAMEALDSKTCYSRVKSHGQLLGYELVERLLVSSSGRLVELQATGAFGVGKRETRRYIGHGITVDIVPQRAMKYEDPEQDMTIVLEEGHAVVSERGRRQRLPVEVSEICTP